MQALAAVQMPGRPLEMVDLGKRSPMYDYTVHFQKLEPGDPGLSVLIDTYSGGAHCCFTTHILQPTAGGIRHIETPEIDAAGHQDSNISDYDGDGYADLRRGDTRFLYEFGSYATSATPPRIWNLFRGTLVDVSDQPAFQPIFTEYAERAKAICGRSDPYRNSACMGYLAASARLGKAAEALEFTETHADNSDAAKVELPTFCRVEYVDYQCPANQDIVFYSFNHAAGWILKDRGYLR